MTELIQDVKIISSFHKKNLEYRKVQSRASHGFFIRLKGSIKYVFADKTLTVNEGEVVFMPQGSTYEYFSSDPENTEYTSINFQADMENAEVCVYSLKDFHGFNFISEGFSEAWKFGNISDKYKCYAVFYDYSAPLRSQNACTS